MKSIYLCGFMGCGKSTVGKILAKDLKCDFVDMDDYIEEREGMSIPEIFEKKGEPYFRETETKVLEELGKQDCVIATGGGALLSEKNAEVAKATGTVVFIDTDFEECYSRIKDDPHRPIATSSTKEQLKERYDQRRPLYLAHSDFRVDGKDMPDELAENIFLLLMFGFLSSYGRRVSGSDNEPKK